MVKIPCWEARVSDAICVAFKHRMREAYVCRGIIPAATGNFVSHGVRTFSYEASFTALTSLTKGAAELQVRTCPGF